MDLDDLMEDIRSPVKKSTKLNNPGEEEDWGDTNVSKPKLIKPEESKVETEDDWGDLTVD